MTEQDNSVKNIRILLVDDEENVLRGMARRIRSAQPTWSIKTAENGVAALEVMAGQTFDVIITDLRMPVMDGSAFLAEASQRSPDTIRLVLSGHADQDALLLAGRHSHQQFPKPTDVDFLIKEIHRLSRGQTIIKDSLIRSRISIFGSKQLITEVDEEVLRALNDPDKYSISEALQKAPQSMFRIIRTANSSFFGTATKIDTIEGAVSLLGLDLVRVVILAQTHLKQDDHSAPEKNQQFLARLWEHSVRTAMLTRKIQNTLSIKVATGHIIPSAAFHDIGKYILLDAYPTEYQEIMQSSLTQEVARPVWEIERERFGNCHAEIGAQVLTLWGMPDEVARAVRLHHTPLLPDGSCEQAAMVLNIANALDHHASWEAPYFPGYLDTQCLCHFGIEEDAVQTVVDELVTLTTV